MGLLTDSEIKKAIKETVHGSDTNLSDGDGLTLRLRKDAKPAWVYRYRRPSDRKQAKLNLGSYPDTSLKAARSEAEKYRKELEAGRDPLMVKSAAYERNAAILTMQQLTEAWLKSARASKVISDATIGKHEWRWNLYLKKHLAGLAATDVTRGHVSFALDAMRNRGVKEEVRKALTTINKILDFGVSRHFIESNPARLLRPKDFGATASKPRKRHLTIAEICQLWREMESAVTGANVASNGRVISFPQANAFKVLIATGARRSEVAEMEWAEVDLEKRVWVLPPERTKNGEGHTVYLSDLAVKVLKGMEAWSKGRTYVFQSDRKEEDAPIHFDSLTQIVLRMTGQKKSAVQVKRGYVAPLEHIEAFTVHDLRRSAATLWGEKLKVWPHVIEKMLNHQPKDKLVGTYQHAAYAAEQRQAWNDWGNYLERKLAGDPANVIEFKRTSEA